MHKSSENMAKNYAKCMENRKTSLFTGLWKATAEARTDVVNVKSGHEQAHLWLGIRKKKNKCQFYTNGS